MTSILNFSTHKTSTNMKPTIVNNVNIDHRSSLQKRVNMRYDKPAKIVKRDLNYDNLDYENAEQSSDITIIKNDETIPSENNQYKTLKCMDNENLAETVDEPMGSDITVIYPDDTAAKNTNYTSSDNNEDVIEILERKCNTYAEYLKICKEQQEFKRSKIILTIDNLKRILAAVTGVDSESINITLDNDIGCFASKIANIDTIQIIASNSISEFKTKYPAEQTFLKLLDIDTKHVLNL